MRHDKDTLAEQVLRVLQQQYDEFDERGDIEINPALLANSAYAILDPEDSSPYLVHYTSVLELRQLARSICRKKLDFDQVSEQGRLFDGQLQPRYPANRSGEEVYVRREFLTLAERNANIARLRSEASAKFRHADALQAETDALERQGEFAEVA